ncbi:MAG: twin-arginine translocase TatA/TatE family subunit [Cryomorphaceae bacterium]|jgi:sec-independent protein translocase protein TatA|nr:twin-arginine translocase TatA/TatE family subunit [Cryomorphaceae bacterium]
MLLFISSAEIIFLLFAVLMLFGTDKLPGFIRMAGKIIRSVRNASNDLKSEISKVSMENSVVKDIEEGVKEIKDTIEDTVSRAK